MIELTNRQVRDFCLEISNELNDIVFNNIHNYLRENPESREYLNPAFPFPHELKIGLLSKYLVVEYIGPSKDEEESFKTSLEYNTNKSLYDFLGIDISHIKCPIIPWNDYIHNMNFFLGDSIKYLTDYFYDFTQCPEDFCLNGLLDISGSAKPSLISNCTFFWSDQEGRLKIKHIDLLELFPYTDEGVLYHSDEEAFVYFSNYIIGLKAPKYKVWLHQKLNEFIHLINIAENEVQITNYLEENPEILQISFGLHDLNPQKDLKWQYETHRKNLKPDFLPQRMDGYCDILEFKLPKLKTKPLVGHDGRQHPSYEVDKAISQLDEYEEWFGQEINRRWLYEEHKIKSLNPTKYLIIGHSNEFSAEDRRKLRISRNTVFFTYDEFIEMVRYQIYRIR